MTIFTNTWHDGRRYLWSPLKDYFKDLEIKYLEIGTYEGNSLIWVIDNLFTNKNSIAHVIDTFDGSIEHSDLEKNSIFSRFLLNINKYRDIIVIHKGYSYNMLISLNNTYTNYFNLIYIDGSHIAKDVLADAILSFSLLKSGGIMIFDDYDSDKEPNNTKLAINCFLECYKDSIEILEMCEQVFVRKR
jgi:predicted O-methyltransferase YrrM